MAYLHSSKDLGLSQWTSRACCWPRWWRPPRCQPNLGPLAQEEAENLLPFLSQKPHRPLPCMRGWWAGCIANPSQKGFDITWAGTVIASCESRTISYRSVLDNAPCRRLCSSRSHCRLRLENLWSKDSIIFIRRQDFWPNFSLHKNVYNIIHCILQQCIAMLNFCLKKSRGMLQHIWARWHLCKPAWRFAM